MELNAELLMRNRFCRGVKRGNEYRCGGDADDNAVNKAVELLSEAINRIRHRKVWETWWIDEIMGEWLEKRDRLETQLRGRYSDEIVNDLLGLVDEFINYNEQFLNYWCSVGSRIRELIEDLLNGRAEVVIRGEDTSGVSVHYGHVTLEVNKTSTGGITVQLVLNGLEGVTIRVPDVFRKTMSEREYKKFVERILKALRGGLEETDGTTKDDKAAMGTTQIWQVVVWTLLYPGEVHMYIDTININSSDITITWRLRSSYDPLKGKILGNVDKLGEEELLAFMFTAVLGDGWADVVKVVINGRAYDEAVIEIAMSDEKFKAWEPLFERLRKIGFKSGKPNPINSNVVVVPFYGSNAIDLAKAMIGILPPILRDVLDALDPEKWISIRRITEMELRFRRGEMQVVIAGYRFTVDVRKDTVMLERKVKDDVEARRVVGALRAVYGGEFVVNINKGGKYLLVRIPMYEFEKHEDIKAQVIEVLCRKLEKTKDERKRQIIIKHLTRLTTPTEGRSRC